MRRHTDALFYTLLFCISCSEFKRPLTKPNQDLINWNQFVSVNICTHSVNYLKLLDGQQVTHDIGLLFYLAVNYLYSKDKFLIFENFVHFRSSSFQGNRYCMKLATPTQPSKSQVTSYLQFSQNIFFTEFHRRSFVIFLH